MQTLVNVERIQMFIRALIVLESELGGGGGDSLNSVVDLVGFNSA
jgi:hypothetical protein